jgi:hypothetical protein
MVRTERSTLGAPVSAVFAATQFHCCCMLQLTVPDASAQQACSSSDGTPTLARASYRSRAGVFDETTHPRHGTRVHP